MRAVPDSTLEDVDQLSGSVILGFDPAILHPESRPPVVDWQGVKLPYEGLLKSSRECRQKAPNYLMRGIVGQVENIAAGSNVTVLNDLKSIDATFRPSEFNFWSFEGYIQGIEIKHINGRVRSHGTTKGHPTHTMALQADGDEIVSDILIRTKPIKNPSPTGPAMVIGSIGLLTTHYRSLDTARDPAHPDAKAPGSDSPAQQSSSQSGSEQPGAAQQTTTSPTTTSETTKQPATPKFEFDTERVCTFTHPDDRIWSFRGFFGLTISGFIVALGPVWGCDSFVPVPPRKPTATLCRDSLYNLGDDVVSNLRLNFNKQPALAGNFLLGSSRQAQKGGTFFNTLDTLESTWKLKTIGFSAQKNVLTGLKLTYTNGQTMSLANYSAASEVWNFDVVSDLVIAKITSGAGAIQTVEFIRSEKDGSPATWPLNVATSRFIADSAAMDSSPMIEAAPRLNNRAWTIRGFYGWHSGGNVVGLGLVWGCG